MDDVQPLEHGLLPCPLELGPSLSPSALKSAVSITSTSCSVSVSNDEESYSLAEDDLLGGTREIRDQIGDRLLVLVQELGVRLLIDDDGGVV